MPLHGDSELVLPWRALLFFHRFAGIEKRRQPRQLLHPREGLDVPGER
jgi:hypothetical protein